MCAFIEAKHVLPGYVCCACKGYNGLQRVECKDCARAICTDVAIPEGIHRCPGCGWGWRGARNWTTRGDGTPVSKDHCPCCGFDLSAPVVRQ